jgi:hypothetical protein
VNDDDKPGMFSSVGEYFVVLLTFGLPLAVIIWALIEIL